jgi:hypothetical protein
MWCIIAACQKKNDKEHKYPKHPACDQTVPVVYGRVVFQISDCN